MRYQLALFYLISVSLFAQNTNDLWLEESESVKVKEWIKTHSGPCRDKLLKSPKFQKIQKQLEHIVESADFPDVFIFKDHAYYFHSDLQSPSGQFRRATSKSYLSGNPNWEICFDLDDYNKKNKTKYSFQTFSICQYAPEKMLFFLSKDGSDIHDMKEYDLNKKAFVKDGFEIKDCKGYADWISEDKILVNATPYKSERTVCGLSYVIREWKRGEKFHFAKRLYKGSRKDGVSQILSLGSGENELLLLSYESQKEGIIELIYDNGKLIRKRHTISVSYFDIYKDNLVCINREAIEIKGKRYDDGCLLFIKIRDYMKQNGRYKVVYEADDSKSVTSASISSNKVFFELSEDVTSTIHELIPKPDGSYKAQEIKFPENSTTYITCCNNYTDSVLFHNTGYITPPTVWLVDSSNGKPKKIRSRKSSIDPANYEVKQFFAESHDYYEIPYFLITAKNKKEKPRPAIIEAYGGFGISQMPYFRESLIKCWIDEGGVYVVANIRGGSEYGRFWHEDAIKMKKYNSYYDFIAITDDLIKRKVTTPQKLGIYGASNGGLLTGVMLTKFPDKFKAVASLCPLYDMTRFHKLGAGQNWLDEYGDPSDPFMHSFLKGYSPYHNLKSDVDYPSTLIMVSENDDRVHPGHARRMANKMFKYNQPITYIEFEGGGHSMNSSLTASILSQSLLYTFFQQQLMNSK